MRPEIVIDTREALARVFAERFAAAARTAIAARGRFSCALPGGSVAETFFPVLARAEVAWKQVELFWGDERAGGPEDPDSSYGLAKRLLLDPVQADPARVHRIAGEGGDLEAAARAYEDEMGGALGEPPGIDLVVLGLGPEGHLCSLFPGHPLLRERARRVAVITDSPRPPPRRITFTMLPLELAGTICVAGFGGSKATAIHEAVDVPDSQIPIALALRAARRGLVLVDPAAGALLVLCAGALERPRPLRADPELSRTGQPQRSRPRTGSLPVRQRRRHGKHPRRQSSDRPPHDRRRAASLDRAELRGRGDRRRG